MREVYNPHEIEARWQACWIATGRSQVDLDHAARPFSNLIEFPYPSGDGVIKFKFTTGNTARARVFAATPWGLRLHSAKVGGIMPLTLLYPRVG